MNKLLIICQNYPSPENPFSQIFIHYRLKAYLSDFELTVLSFAAKKSYVYDGIRVEPERDIQRVLKNKKFATVVAHAPNLRNHYRFLFQNFRKFKSVVLIFHGYEVIDIQKRVYSMNNKMEPLKRLAFLSMLYNRLKLPLTKCCLFLLIRLMDLRLIFVSNSLLAEARSDLGFPAIHLGPKVQIVNNPINPIFHKESFRTPISAKADFVCIRPLDDPKYGVDLFIHLAQKNIDHTFHLYGRGIIPKNIPLPKNLSIFNSFISNQDLPAVLGHYKCAVLPTRWDSQGVLACEIATLGMPLITSDLEVCREMLKGFENVVFIPNEKFADLDLSKLLLKTKKSDKNIFDHANTSAKEIELVKRLIEEHEG